MHSFGHARSRNIAGKAALLLLLSFALAILSAPFGFLPAQQAAYAVDAPDTVSASAALLVEGATGRVLYEQDAHAKLFPASTTKIMTALLVLEAVDAGKLALTDEITASSAMVNSVIWDASHVSPRIKIGETLTVSEYLYCVMLDSDCASCNILAERVAGSVAAFVKLMNTRAAELGCENTHFVNTHGYPDKNHYTTAWSIYLISAQAMKNPTFAQIVATKYHQVPESNLARARDLYNTNLLLHNVSSTDYYFEGTVGIKTGTTDDAGYCLSACAERDGMTLYSVVLGAAKVKREDGSDDRQSFSESKRLLDWGFSSYAYRDVLSTGRAVSAMEVDGAGGIDAELVPVSASSVLLPVDAKVETEVVYSLESLVAPVDAGTEVGEVFVRADGEIIARSKVVVSETIEERKGLRLLISWLTHGDTISPVLLYNALILIIVLIVLITCLVSRRKPRDDCPDAPPASLRGRHAPPPPDEADDPLLGLSGLSRPLPRERERYDDRRYDEPRYDDRRSAVPFRERSGYREPQVAHSEYVEPQRSRAQYSTPTVYDDSRYLPPRMPSGYASWRPDDAWRGRSDNYGHLVSPSEYNPADYAPFNGSLYPPDDGSYSPLDRWDYGSGRPYR